MEAAKTDQEPQNGADLKLDSNLILNTLVPKAEENEDSESAIISDFEEEQIENEQKEAMPDEPVETETTNEKNEEPPTEPVIEQQESENAKDSTSSPIEEKQIESEPAFEKQPEEPQQESQSEKTLESVNQETLSEKQPEEPQSEKTLEATEEESEDKKTLEEAQQETPSEATPEEAQQEFTTEAQDEPKLEEPQKKETEKEVPPVALAEIEPVQVEVSEPSISETSESPKKQLTLSLNTESILITVVDEPKMAVDESEAAVSEEPEEPEEPEVPPIATSRMESRYSEEELDAALTKLLKKGDLPPFDMRQDVINYARKVSVAAIVNEDYDRAESMDRAVAIISQASSSENVVTETSYEKELLKQRLDEAEKSQQDIEDHWNEVIESYKQKERERIAEMEQRHEQEIRQLEWKWDQPEAMIPYSKPSPQLLQLRRQQKVFAIAHNFADAKALKIKADNMQKAETLEAQKRAAEVMRHEFKLLREKQQKEIRCGEENWTRKIETLEKEKKKALEAKENLKKQLSNKISAAPVPKKEKVMLPVIGRDARTPRGQSGMYSYRTRSRFADYKKSTENGRLEVKVDTKNIIRPSTVKTPRRKQ